MKLRTARLGVLLVAFLGLMATMIPSASATSVKLVTFTGFANLGGGLGYPGAGSGPTPNPDVNKVPCTTNGAPDTGCVTTTTDNPKGGAVVGFAPEGNHAGFSFNSTACVKVSVSDLKKAPGPALCVIKAEGVVWGYCGLSTGMGAATLENLGPAPFDKATVSTGINFTGVGGVLYVTGGNTMTNVRAVVSAVPVPSTPGGPSCTNKSANQFLLTGEAVFKDIN